MEPFWRVEMMGELRAVPQPGLTVLRAAAGAGPEPLPIVTHFRTQKTAVLLAYLAYYPDRAHPRDELVELLWPGTEPELGRNNLSKALSALRAVLEPVGVPDGAVLVAARASARLRAGRVTTDVAELEAGFRLLEGQSILEDQRAALALDAYRGRLMPGHYDAWIVSEQERLDERFFRALSRMISLLEEEGKLESALEYARRGVAVDPLREEARREVIRLLLALGQPAAALRQFRDLERRLQEEMQVAPEGETRALVAGWLSGFAATNPSPASGAAPPTPALPSTLDAVGGAMPLDSRFYIVRPTDGEFHAALQRQDSIVLLKGARQTGKTSLLARGLQQARAAGATIVLTDLQSLNAAQLASPEAFFLALAHRIAPQLAPLSSPSTAWDPDYGANLNFELFLRSAVLNREEPIVWGLDEVDRLFTCDFGSDVFGLFRSWHNKRPLDPDGPWPRLTLAIAYATEAHLFISDLNQSPFNVGTQLSLGDFTRAQVSELNQRYGGPLTDDRDVERLFLLLDSYFAVHGFRTLSRHSPVGRTAAKVSAEPLGFLPGLVPRLRWLRTNREMSG